jgi:hypothetical protein
VADVRFDEVWQRIEAHAGETFRQIRGCQFAYEVRAGRCGPTAPTAGSHARSSRRRSSTSPDHDGAAPAAPGTELPVRNPGGRPYPA